MLDWLGLGKVVGDVANEFIDTDEEKANATKTLAEAKVMGIKAIDPNGQMRRELARFASIAFGFYLVNCVVLSYMVAFGIGDVGGAEKALESLFDLFLPVLGAWTTIISASFGVNASNNWKDVKLGGKSNG